MRRKYAEWLQIFEPFYTTKFVGRRLGLALTVGIMQSHHGAITVESTPSQGTTVRLLLPLVSAIQQVRPVDGVAQGDELTFSGNILLADDDKMVLNVGREMLEHLGFTVHTAGNGQEAFALPCKCYLRFSLPHIFDKLVKTSSAVIRT